MRYPLVRTYWIIGIETVILILLGIGLLIRQERIRILEAEMAAISLKWQQQRQPSPSESTPLQILSTTPSITAESSQSYAGSSTFQENTEVLRKNDLFSQDRWLRQVDIAMDREFSRLEDRLQNSVDPLEQTILSDLRDGLFELDQIWIEMDSTTDVMRKKQLRQQAQDLMGDVIQLGAQDKKYALRNLAIGYGLSDTDHLDIFIHDVEETFRKTHLDWARIFSRGF